MTVRYGIIQSAKNINNIPSCCEFISYTSPFTLQCPSLVLTMTQRRVVRTWRKRTKKRTKQEMVTPPLSPRHTHAPPPLKRTTSLTPPRSHLWSWRRSCQSTCLLYRWVPPHHWSAVCPYQSQCVLSYSTWCVCVFFFQGCRSVEEFQCLNRIEEGTYGVVYRAKDKKTGMNTNSGLLSLLHPVFSFWPFLFQHFICQTSLQVLA